MIARCLTLLERWLTQAEAAWYDLPHQSGLGCYGTGYGTWGVQTNQRYASAAAVLGMLGPAHLGLSEAAAAHWRQRALAALRFSLWSHRSGPGACTDGAQWGHHWLSALGLERMLHGVYLLEPELTAADRADLQRVLLSEAAWIAEHHVRGKCVGVDNHPWNHSGRNAPESNLWNGATLWRAACSAPEHPAAAAWRERAHQFLMNSISVPADAQDNTPVAGRPVREWHVGAGFFPNYALDHHGYLNVGYQVICLSNAAMLHYDARQRGWPAPASLYHHNGDLWQVVRRTVFSDGRLARIGGDSRVRYAYCQEYLLPTLVYAVDHLGDAAAAPLLEAQLQLIEQEAAHHGDGSFYGGRLEFLRQTNSYYHYRLESDRACALGMTAAYLAQRGAAWPAGDRAAFEASAAGAWHEPEHGAVLHRCPTRLAAFAWRAHGLTQGMCQPPGDGHLAEWHQNLAGVVRCMGDAGPVAGGHGSHRRLLAAQTQPFPGGFLTWGAVMEGTDLGVPEGWQGTDSARHDLVVAALPDGHTMVGLQFVRAGARRVYTLELKGLHLNLPNDLYNGCRRELETAAGPRLLTSPPAAAEVVPLGAWACLPGAWGVAGIYGAPRVVSHRVPQRRGGAYQSLYCEELCYGCQLGPTPFDAGAVMLDVGWLVVSAADAAMTRRAAASASAATGLPEGLRAVRVLGQDRVAYLLAANFGATPQPVAALLRATAGTWRNLVAATLPEHLAPGAALLLRQA